MYLCGQRWIRTTEGVSQQIYSLPHLATLVFALVAAGVCVTPYFYAAKLWIISVTAKRSLPFL